MHFFPYRPISISKASNGLIASDKSSISDFWSRVNGQLEDGLSEAVGCYIFSIRAGKGVVPWYVGLAEKQVFRKECFTSHKLNHYNRAIAARKGTPVITFITKYTNGDKYAKPSKNGHGDIRFLEAMLIGTCIRRNLKLLNIRDTKLLRGMVVHGLLNTPKGREYASVREFRALVGAS